MSNKIQQALEAIGKHGCDCDAVDFDGEHTCIAGLCENAIVSLKFENEQLTKRLNKQIADFNRIWAENERLREMYKNMVDEECKDGEIKKQLKEEIEQLKSIGKKDYDGMREFQKKYIDCDHDRIWLEKENARLKLSLDSMRVEFEEFVPGLRADRKRLWEENEQLKKTRGSACTCDKCCGYDPLPCGHYPGDYCDCEEQKRAKEDKERSEYNRLKRRFENE